MKKGKAYNASSPLLGNGVFTAQGNFWHKQRLTVQKGFSTIMMKNGIPCMKKTARDLVVYMKVAQKESAKEITDFDILKLMIMTSLETICQVSFGYEIGCFNKKKGNEIIGILSIIFNTFGRRISSPYLQWTKSFPTAENTKLNASLEKLNIIVRDIIAKRRKSKRETEKINLLDIILESDFNEEQVTDNVKNVLFAGFDTTASTLCWSFYVLAKRPDIQSKIRAEMDKQFGSKLDTLDGPKLEKLTYLNAVVMEIFRLYPGAAFTRTTLEEICVGGYTIPAGVDIGFTPYIYHRDERNFRNAKVFCPERWLTGDRQNVDLFSQLSTAAVETAFLTFGYGKQNCVGRKLSALETRIVILYVLRNFEVFPAIKQHPEFQETPFAGVTLIPQHMRVGFKPRKV
eukprot:snap_masked-scaffold_8-processed-gene-4.19-mRNA-1 protein AED:1.00 eAED:1.00 QI:0/-1/0/0/-1/1/1/0/400